jgi:ABC-2 type transport system permease protein
VRRDKRTLALIFFAPLIVLTLVYMVLDSPAATMRVGIINAPLEYAERLEDYNLRAVRLTEAEAMAALLAGQITASVDIVDGKPYIVADGSDPGKAGQAIQALQQAIAPPLPPRPDLRAQISYIYGAADLSKFDNFGAVLIGFVVFFFVFLLSGISFLQERLSGTLEKLLSTPIRRWQIVVGYICGFGVLTALQSLVIVVYSVYVLHIMMVGSFALVILITLLGALNALSMGVLISTGANSEFQMMQFIPLIVIPQAFFSGLFDLSPGLAAVGRVMPLYYIAEAMRTVMLKGGGLHDISKNLLVICAFSAVFMIANVLLLKKHRRI